MDYYQDPNVMPQPDMYPTPFSYPNNFQREEERTLVKQIDPSHLLQEIIHGLRGEIKEEDEEGKIKWTKLGVPLMNEEGIRSLISDLNPVLSQNTTLSNLQEDEVATHTIEIGKIVVLKIADQYKNWGVDKSNLSTAVMNVTEPINMALKRGMKEGERKFLKTTIRSTEQIGIRPVREEGDKHFWEFWKK
jgi:hypothetical protein